MKKRHPFSLPVGLSYWSLPLVSLLFVSFLIYACGGSVEVAENPEDSEVGTEAEINHVATDSEVDAKADTGYDATEILAQLTDEEVDEDPQQIADLAQENDPQLQDRQARQAELEAQRKIEAENRKEQKVEAIGVWLESYQAATAESLSALGSVQTALTGVSESDDLRKACESLSRAIQTIDEQVLEAPDPVIATLLRKAWDRYRSASNSCTKGQMRDLSTQLLEGQKAMKNANGLLQGYGKSL